jgi:[ribosomal protein S5]-alanine N-acetyltransferase
MYKEIQTERLLMRPINLGDKNFIYSLVNTNGWLKYIGDRNIKNIADAENYIQKILENKNYYYNVFEIKDTKEPIGIITFLNRDSQEFPDIGFALLPQFEKKGYTFEASKKYLAEIISLNLYKKIIGITVPENYNSIKLLQRLGLDFETNFTENNEILSLYSITI